MATRASAAERKYKQEAETLRDENEELQEEIVSLRSKLDRVVAIADIEDDDSDDDDSDDDDDEQEDDED